MPWPWENRAKPPAEESRAAEPPPVEDATARWAERLYRETDKADVFKTAAVEAAAGLWGRALAAADVTPAAPALAGVTPDFLAWAGRALIYKGEAVAVIEIAEGMARLLPCATQHVETGSSDPGSWIYRCEMIGPNRHRSRRVPAAGVVHLRWGVRRNAPWRGLSPIRESEATGRLHARATAMASYLADPALSTTHATLRDMRETGIPLPTPDQVQEISETIDDEWKARRNGRVVPFLGAAELAVPVRDKTSESERELLESTAAAIFGACGIPPQLLSLSGEATIAREAWRLFYLSAVAPVARCIEGELRAKLHPAAMLGFDMLRASDQDQLSRAVERRARAYKALRDAGIEDAEARRLAGLADSP